MKHYFKFINLCLLIIAVLISCDTDDDLTELRDVKDVGGYAHLVTPRISQFDTDSDLTVRLFTASGVSVETVEIIRDGAVLGTATIEGDTATFNSSILGDISVGTYPVVVRASLSNGKFSERPFNITAVNSLSISQDNPEEATLSGLDTTEVSYSLFNLEATVDNVDLHLKNGADGTYIESGVDEIDGSVELGDTNYQALNLSVNDTLYYRFTATSAELSQSAESFIVIVEEPEENNGGNGEDD